MDADANRTPAHLPKTEAGRPGRAPVNFQPGVIEATASAADNLTMPITVAEACERNACDVRARYANLTKKQRTDNLTEERRQPKPGKGVLKHKAIKRFSAA